MGKSKVDYALTRRQNTTAQKKPGMSRQERSQIDEYKRELRRLHETVERLKKKERAPRAPKRSYESVGRKAIEAMARKTCGPDCEELIDCYLGCEGQVPHTLGMPSFPLGAPGTDITESLYDPLAFERLGGQPWHYSSKKLLEVTTFGNGDFAWGVFRPNGCAYNDTANTWTSNGTTVPTNFDMSQTHNVAVANNSTLFPMAQQTQPTVIDAVSFKHSVCTSFQVKLLGNNAPLLEQGGRIGIQVARNLNWTSNQAAHLLGPAQFEDWYAFREVKSFDGQNVKDDLTREAVAFGFPRQFLDFSNAAQVADYNEIHIEDFAIIIVIAAPRSATGTSFSVEIDASGLYMGDDFAQEVHPIRIDDQTVQCARACLRAVGGMDVGAHTSSTRGIARDAKTRAGNANLRNQPGPVLAAAAEASPSWSSLIFKAVETAGAFASFL